MAFNWTPSKITNSVKIDDSIINELKTNLDTLSGGCATHKATNYIGYCTTDRATVYSTKYAIHHSTANDAWGGSTCFPAGTMVLLEDGSWKAIEMFSGGENIVGLTKINTVAELDTVKLSDTRVLYTLTNKKIYFTGEHKFWVRFDDMTEGPVVHNYGEYHYDWLTSPKTEELSRYPHVAIRFEYFDYATIWGWSRESWKFDPEVMRQYDPEQELYSLKLTGPDHMMIANGYVVSAWMTDFDFDYSVVNWNPERVLSGINVQPLHQ